MYNLFVSGNDEAWHGGHFEIELSRCVREYTAPEITERYGCLDRQAAAALKRLPCIFAYEAVHGLPPQFGRIVEVTRRHNDVRIEYRLEPVNPFLTHEDITAMAFELEIGRMEMNRTHWAVKEVNLVRELARKGIPLPSWTQSPRINISTHQFDVALSFPGEERALVEQIAAELEHNLGPERCFYDRNYAGHLARPGMDVLLQGIYRERSKLIVVFISGSYQTKDWCGVEFRAIRDIINRRQVNRVMYIKTGDGNVEGVLPNDGYVDARHYSPRQLAEFIEQRLDELRL
ncbi:TIR domain-containing protein [Methylobacterium phyllosphaerae]